MPGGLLREAKARQTKLADSQLAAALVPSVDGAGTERMREWLRSNRPEGQSSLWH